MTAATATEAEIGDLLRAGLTNDAVATRVGASVKRVRTIRQRLGIPPTRPARSAAPTLAAAFNARTRATGGGHMRWTGSVQSNGGARLTHRGVPYTARAAAYIIRTGHRPLGLPQPVCGRPTCVAPDHIVDISERPFGAIHGAPIPGAPVPTRWRDSAACTRHDLDLMDPPPGDKDAIEDAKAICAACPVRDACLRAAMAEEGGAEAARRAGIRGGHTPEERVAIWRMHLRQPRVAEAA